MPTDQQDSWLQGAPLSTGLVNTASSSEQDAWYAGAPLSTFASIDLTQTLSSAAGIVSAEAFDVGIIAGPITGSAGIASGEALESAGAVAFPPQSITGTAGIESTEAVGTAGALAGFITGSAGIASDAVVGSAGALVGPLTGSAGIESAEAFGESGVMSTGTLTGDAGIVSEEAFGSDGTLGSIGGPLVGVSGIDTAEWLGIGVIAGPIAGTNGITSTESFGTDGSISGRIRGNTGIVSAEDFGRGGVLLRSLEGIRGIDSEEAFGTSGALLSFTVFGEDASVSNFALYIGGKMRTEYLVSDTLRVDRQLNFQAAASLELEDSAGQLPINIGDEVIIYHFDENIEPERPGTGEWSRAFGGTIESYDMASEHVSDERIRFSVSCVDYGRSLSKRILNRSYPASEYGSLVAIMQDLADTLLAEEGLTWDASSTPDVEISDIEFSYTALNEVLDKLAEIAEASWQVDFFKTLTIEDRTHTTDALVSITQDTTGPDAYLWSDLRVSRNRGLFRNKQYVKTTAVSSTEGSPTSSTPSGLVVTETYTFPTFHPDLAKAFRFQVTVEPEAGVTAITQDDQQRWAVAALQLAPTIWDSAYDGRVYGVQSLKWNGSPQTVTKASTPEVSGGWLWNDDNSWLCLLSNSSASRVHNAEVAFIKRLNDPHNAAPTMPAHGDTVEVTWILDSPTGTTATHTYTFSTYTGQFLPVGGVVAVIESELAAVYLQQLVYWPMLHDEKYDSQTVLGIRRIFRNGVEEAIASATRSGDWTWDGHGRLYSTNRHSLLGGSVPRQPANGDTVVVEWEVAAPSGAAAEVSSTTGGTTGTDIIGIWEAVDELPGVTDPVLIQQYTDSLLAKFGVMGIEVDFTTLRYGLAPGQEIFVHLPKYGVENLSANVESITMQEQAMRVFRQTVKVSNQIQQRDALAAFNRLIKRIKKAEQQVKSTITFHLAETIQGVTNPGLVTGTNVATAYIARRNITLTDVAIYFKTPPTGASVKLDINVNGVSCLEEEIEFPAGQTEIETFTKFVSSAFTIQTDDIVTIDVTQVGSLQPGKDGTVVLSGWVS